MKTTNKIHYVYKITNLNPTDERLYYIGVKSSLDPDNDNYMGSSKYLDEAMKEIGSEHFKKEVLSTWETRKEAVQEEIRLHEYFDVARNKLFYNKAKQKSDGFDCYGASFVFSDSHKLKISEKLKGITRSDKTKSLMGENHADVSGTNNPMFGNGYKNSGKNHYLNMMSEEERKSWISKNLIGRNIQFSPQAKENISNGAKNRKRGICPHCNNEADMSNLKQYHYDKCLKHPTNGDKNKKSRELICPNCGKIGTSIGPMKQWHFDNCKFIKL